MDNDKNLPNSGDKCTTGCGSGCNCCASGIGKKWKLFISLAVVIAAAIILAYGAMQKAEAQSDLDSPWADPIESLSSLDEMASQKDAVFLYLPAEGQGLDENVTKEIQSAADKAESKGTTTAFFALEDGSEDYAQLTSQVDAPFVLVMVKGSNMTSVPGNISQEFGMSVVSGEISEENLLYALVAASRPSAACCPPSTPSPSTRCC